MVYLCQLHLTINRSLCFAFQFPLYWFSMPAIMKGWIDRVLVQGFAHNFPQCYDDGLLKVCSLDCYIRLNNIFFCIILVCSYAVILFLI